LRPRLLLPAVMAGLLAVVLLLGGADTARSQSFNPTLNVTISSPEAGVNSDLIVDFRVPEGDVNFGAAVFFVPPEWGLASADEVPIGAVIGEVLADATLGIVGAACNSSLPVKFTMVNASIDLSATISYLDDDALDETGFGIEEVFEDEDESGLQDGIERYPDFITRLLVDEDDQPLQPVSRAVGITIVAGVNVMLQFLLFEPGTFIDERIPNDPELGSPSVTLLQNIGDPDFDPVPSAITDFCSPLSSVITIFGISKDNACTDAGADTVDPICDVTSAPLEVTDEGDTDPDEGGVPLFTNPSEGTYTFTLISAGQPDADGDGYENALDTCPLLPNLGDTRIQGDGDADGDGLDGACDPDDNAINSDEDLDGYLNRQDNCPTKSNGEEGSNQRDTDDDFIGDDCDPDPEDADAQGELPIVEVAQDVTIGPGGPPAQETPTGEGTPGDNATASNEEGDDSGLGAGAIAGIVVAVIAAAVVLGGGAFYFLRRGSA